jgi:hypothetical protein
MSDTNIDTLRGKFFPIKAELSTGFIRSLAAAGFLSLREFSLQAEGNPVRSTLRKIKFSRE